MPASAPLDGILNLDKPAGWTSHDVVAWVRRTLRQRRAGHAGTLDPLATGVLLVCVGQATRVAEYLMGSDKTYRAVVRFGIATDTYDSAGQVLATDAVPHLTTGDLRRALQPLTGEILQVPPAYSAIKQGGVAAYRKARRGESVVLPARPVTIYRIDLLEWQTPDLTLEVTCSAGTYIRSLAQDLGQALGCGAHLAALVRERSGEFNLCDAVSLDTLAAAAAEGGAGRHLHAITKALGHLVAVEVDTAAATRLAFGQPIECSLPPTGPTGYARLPDGQVAAIVTYREGSWWPHKVFAAGDDPPAGSQTAG